MSVLLILSIQFPDPAISFKIDAIGRSCVPLMYRYFISFTNDDF